VESLRQGEPARVLHAELLERGDKIGRLPGERCPLCGSVVSEQSFQEHIAIVRTEIQAGASGIIDALARQQAARRQKDDAERQLNDARRQLSEHTSVIGQMERKLADVCLEAVSQGLQAENGPPLTGDIQSLIESVRGTCHQLEEGIRWLESFSVMELVQSLEVELEQVKQSANEAFTAVSRSEKVIGRVREAQKGVKSLLGEIMDEQLSELSPLIEELYRRLRPHMEWTSIRYRLRGDVRRMLSFEVGDGLNPSFVFSSGQRRAAGLAFLLAVHLSRPWCLLESVLLDDPVQHIDDFRALNVTEVLASVRKTGRQVLCCIEDEALGQLMCRRLRSGTEADGRIIRMQYDCERGVTKVFQDDVGPSRQYVLVPA
jgi:wobble nucleotide-excising tRNase